MYSCMCAHAPAHPHAIAYVEVKEQFVGRHFSPDTWILKIKLPLSSLVANAGLLNHFTSHLFFFFLKFSIAKVSLE